MKYICSRVGIALAGFALMAVPLSPARADSVSGDLFYTTFKAPNPFPIGPPFLSSATAGKVHFDYNGTTTFTLSGTTTLVDWGTTNANSGADGLIFAPNGHLLVGGADTGVVHDVNLADNSFVDKTAGTGNAFHLALSPDKNTVFSAGIPGVLSTYAASPFGNGTAHTLSGDDSAITQIAFAGSQAFYTSSGIGGDGNFGTIDLSTFTTTRLVTGLAAAHGMVFDPFTGDLILSGDGHITQIDPANPTAIVSDLALSQGSNSQIDHFDQLSVDGKGHLFAAANNGNLTFVDYNTSKLVGDAGNFHDTKFLASFLDDVSPLSGPGAPPTQGPGPGPTPVPLPEAVWMGLIVLGAMGASGGLRKRFRLA